MDQHQSPTDEENQIEGKQNEQIEKVDQIQDSAGQGQKLYKEAGDRKEEIKQNRQNSQIQCIDNREEMHKYSIENNKDNAKSQRCLNSFQQWRHNYSGQPSKITEAYFIAQINQLKNQCQCSNCNNQQNHQQPTVQNEFVPEQNQSKLGKQSNKQTQEQNNQNTAMCLQGLFKIYQFYCHVLVGGMKNTDFDKVHTRMSTLSINKFMLLCRNLGISAIKPLKTPILYNIYKQNSQFRKKMGYQQFLQALIQIYDYIVSQTSTKNPKNQKIDREQESKSTKSKNNNHHERDQDERNYMINEFSEQILNEEETDHKKITQTVVKKAIKQSELQMQKWKIEKLLGIVGLNSGKKLSKILEKIKSMQKECPPPQQPIYKQSEDFRTPIKPNICVQTESSPPKYRFKIFASNGRAPQQVKEELERRKNKQHTSLNKSNISIKGPININEQKFNLKHRRIRTDISIEISGQTSSQSKRKIEQADNKTIISKYDSESIMQRKETKRYLKKLFLEEEQKKSKMGYSQMHRVNKVKKLKEQYNYTQMKKKNNFELNSIIQQAKMESISRDQSSDNNNQRFCQTKNRKNEGIKNLVNKKVYTHHVDTQSSLPDSETPRNMVKTPYSAMSNYINGKYVAAPSEKLFITDQSPEEEENQNQIGDYRNLQPRKKYNEKKGGEQMEKWKQLGLGDLIDRGSITPDPILSLQQQLGD